MRNHPHPDAVVAANSPPNKYWSHPNKPIGGGNPYWCCSSCGKSDPAINGDLFNHFDECEWANTQIALLFDPLTRLDELATVAEFTITSKKGMVDWVVKMDGAEEEEGFDWTPSQAVKSMLQLVGLLPEGE